MNSMLDNLRKDAFILTEITNIMNQLYALESSDAVAKKFHFIDFARTVTQFYCGLHDIYKGKGTAPDNVNQFSVLIEPEKTIRGNTFTCINFIDPSRDDQNNIAMKITLSYMRADKVINIILESDAVNRELDLT